MFNYAHVITVLLVIIIRPPPHTLPLLLFTLQMLPSQLDRILHRTGASSCACLQVCMCVCVIVSASAVAKFSRLTGCPALTVAARTRSQFHLLAHYKCLPLPTAIVIVCCCKGSVAFAWPLPLPLPLLGFCFLIPMTFARAIVVAPPPSTPPHRNYAHIYVGMFECVCVCLNNFCVILYYYGLTHTHTYTCLAECVFVLLLTRSSIYKAHTRSTHSHTLAVSSRFIHYSFQG